MSKTALGLNDVSGLSGEALRRQMTATISRVEEKRNSVVLAFQTLLDIEIMFDEIVQSSFSETVNAAKTARDAGIMSIDRAVLLIGGDDEEIKKLEAEEVTEVNNFGGLVSGEE